jgi:peroxiredoxin Q/BCP
MLKVGDPVPSVRLLDAGGAEVDVAELGRGRPLVVYFYPKDDTLVCTQQARGFRDDYARFQEAGAEVVGISADPPASHRAFAEKHALPFVLLTDAGGAAARAFGVGKTLGFLAGRATFVFGADGRLRSRFTSALRGQAHVDHALEALR